MPRLLLLPALCVAFAVVVGCNGPADEGTTAEPGKIDRGANSPAGTVLRLWREIQGGSPTMVLRYHPRIRRAVGSSGILAVFQPPPAAFGGDPRVLSVNSTPLGMQVIVRSRPPGSKRRITSVYLLGKSGKRWLVRFDNNLNNAVAAYVTRKAQLRVNPNAKATSGLASDAGDRAAARLRSLFVPGPLNGTLVRGEVGRAPEAAGAP